MAKIIRLSTVAWLALGVGLLSAAACDDDNAPGRQVYTHSELFGAVAGAPAGFAGTPSSADWTRQFVLCATTKAGIAIGKNVPCTEADTQACWKTCGPYASGFKELTCSGAAYAEDSMCRFWPLGNFSCFKIPEPEKVDPRCPTDIALAPRHGFECNMEECIVCGGNSYEQTTGYRDQGQGLLKVGYCTCRQTVDATTGIAKKKWNCATMGTAWPCPNGYGC